MEPGQRTSWTTLASAAVVRQYHSIAMLLPDGRVLTGGGGICGSCQQQGYLRKDTEVYTPPYLFARDGSGTLAPRPSRVRRPVAGRLSTSRSRSASPDADRITKIGLIRLGAPTHSQDQGQRYLPLSFTRSGGELSINAPPNAAEAPPGYYMLFLVDSDGVPSVAPIVQVMSPAPGGYQGAATRSGGAPLIAYAGTGAQRNGATVRSGDVAVLAGQPRLRRQRPDQLRGRRRRLARHALLRRRLDNVHDAASGRQLRRFPPASTTRSVRSASSRTTATWSTRWRRRGSLQSGGVSRVDLTWTASTDNVGVSGYAVHRSTVAGFTPGLGNVVANVSQTSFTDTPLTPGTYYYRVTARDAAGNISAPSAEVNATVTGDTTPPTVSITSPAAGASVSGTVTVAADRH